MKVAIVYDWINQFGGAERVVESILKIWKDPVLFASVYDKNRAGWADNFKIHSSFLDKFPFARKNYRLYFSLMPLAFENFNFDDFEIVISITSDMAKAVITKPQTFHLCYLLSPPRYLYGRDYLPVWQKRLLFLNCFKKRDLILSRRPDAYLTISKNIKNKIKRIYDQNAEIVYPGIDLEKFRNRGDRGNGGKRGDFFLVVSRLVYHKRIDIVIETLNQLGWRLKIIGLGRDENRLRKMAGKNVEFLGFVTDEKLVGYYENCLAAICPQDEDFGLVQIEAQACGAPVIAFGAGGSLETVIKGKTGEFFDQQTSKSLFSLLKRFNSEQYSITDCRGSAERFDVLKFKTTFKKIVERKWQEYLKSISTF